MNHLNTPRLLTLTETGELMQASKPTVHRMLRRNELPAFKIGRQWRVRESELTKWILGRENAPYIAQRPQNSNTPLI
ncbi:MAG TPA: helix-turn-helix domain-containing protein [Pyrinomonadaceae bacterium]|nr:helix-turn-helix domain-containing protein [Pyrinomonadaceae bacterium]